MALLAETGASNGDVSREGERESSGRARRVVRELLGLRAVGRRRSTKRRGSRSRRGSGSSR